MYASALVFHGKRRRVATTQLRLVRGVQDTDSRNTHHRCDLTSVGYTETLR